MRTMKNVLTTLALVVVCTFGGYYLAQFWAPLGWIGLIGAIAAVGLYIYGQNRRIQ